MNNPELVKVGHTRHHLRELKVVDEQEGKTQGNNSRLTSCNRFASGLDLAYCITFPLGIHSVIMRKHCESVDTETPNKGMRFGWDRCFQLMISRHSR